jgi:hypothetical protein
MVVIYSSYSRPLGNIIEKANGVKFRRITGEEEISCELKRDRDNIININ